MDVGPMGWLYNFPVTFTDRTNIPTLATINAIYNSESVSVLF